MEDKEVFMIFGEDSKLPEGVYSRSCHLEYEFNSPESARGSNCHGTYQDREKYKIRKYKVTYTLIEEEG